VRVAVNEPGGGFSRKGRHNRTFGKGGLMALNHTADDSHKFRFDENMRGVVVMVLGCVALVGLAFGAMVVLTSPEGWVTKAASSAVSGEQVELVSADPSPAE